MVSVAAPVQPAEGPATAAIQVAGTDQEIPDERIDTLGNEVQRAAYAIARRN
jgi:IclR family acetate operon transcriptional repressor